MNEGNGVPPFRVVAIVQECRVAEKVLEVCGLVPEVPIGMMLRNPEHDPEQVFRLATEVQLLGLPSHTTLITNRCFVDGIEWRHLTSAELQSRAIPTGSFGASAHNPQEARNAESAGASYLTYSPIFQTSSKPETEPIGLAGLSLCLKSLSIPIFALGGIDSVEKGESCIDAGAYGIAGIALAQQKGLLKDILQRFAQI